MFNSKLYMYICGWKVMDCYQLALHVKCAQHNAKLCKHWKERRASVEVSGIGNMET